MEILTYNPNDSSLIAQQQQNPEHRQTSRTLKVLGAVQIGLGLVLAILTIIPAKLIVMPVFGCCFWYVITGSLPLFITNNLDSNFRCKKISFMVCSIIGAVIFSPVIIFSSILKIILTGSEFDRGNKNFYATSIPMGLLSIAVLVVTIISASYCCCCSPFDIQNQQQTVVFVNASQPANIASTIGNPFAGANEQPVMITIGGTNNQSTLYPKSPQHEVVCGTNPETENPLNHKSFDIDPPPYMEYE